MSIQLFGIIRKGFYNSLMVDQLSSKSRPSSERSKSSRLMESMSRLSRSSSDSLIFLLPDCSAAGAYAVYSSAAYAGSADSGTYDC